MKKWRERVGIEPTADVISARRPDLKSGGPTSDPSAPVQGYYNGTGRKIEGFHSSTAKMVSQLSPAPV